MRLRSLNAWERLGVVVSTLWCVSTGFCISRQEFDLANKKASAVYNACLRGGNLASDCIVRHDQIFQYSLLQSGADILIFVFSPVIAGWISVSIALWTIRWVLAGRT